MRSPTPAEGYWNQRLVLRDARERLIALEDAVNDPRDLTPSQWAQLMAFAIEFRPTLILELGRGLGNSTCAFTEAASRLDHGSCRVLSLCNTDHWVRRTLPKVLKVVPPEWPAPLQPVVADILTYDFEAALAGVERVFLFWDAHGFDIAECVLGKILPLLENRPHVVAMHDLSDARYLGASDDQYGGRGLWRGEGSTGSGPRVRLGNINSEVGQVVAITDFCSRNRIPLDSADHSYHTELEPDPKKMEELRAAVGDRHFSLRGDWFWFSLNDASGPFTFPAVTAFTPAPPPSRLRRELSRVASLLRRL
jgi:hypothetical protein